jgi:hypothetical protein
MRVSSDLMLNQDTMRHHSVEQCWSNLGLGLDFGATRSVPHVTPGCPGLAPVRANGSPANRRTEMTEDKSQSKSVEAATAEAMRTEAVNTASDEATIVSVADRIAAAGDEASPARDEHSDAARPKQSGKRRGAGSDRLGRAGSVPRQDCARQSFCAISWPGGFRGLW